jgi:putative transcription factor
MQDLYCDICGKAPVRAQILLEGARLLACGSCMRGGKILHRFDDEGAPLVRPAASAVETTEEVVEGFGRIIKGAREKSGLPVAVVAERINEKESYLTALEHERFMPTLEVARKLEKELGVKLIEKTQSVAGGPAASAKGFSEPTLADMVEAKKKGKGK